MLPYFAGVAPLVGGPRHSEGAFSCAGLTEEMCFATGDFQIPPTLQITSWNPAFNVALRYLSTLSAGDALMTVKTMEDLFVETLKDIYYAEKHILKALPGMVKKAGSKKLKEALEGHRRETEGQVDRLDQVFRLFDLSPRGKKCQAIEGIIAEAKEHMEDIEDPEVLDAGMIGSAQAVEHYEITRYGTLIAWAKQLGRDDAIELLEANLEQEKNADKLLTEIAEAAVNQRAAA
jgi:ferritin-like metal-binding protein YciE